MKFKKFISFALSLAVFFSLSACTKKQDNKELEKSTKYAKVTEINGNEVTLILGEIDESLSPFPNGETPPAMPDGEMPPAMPDGEMPPAMPDGEMPPAMPDGEMPPAMPDGEMPPAMPDGEMPPAMPDGEMPPAMPDGEMPPAMPDGETPPAMPDGEMPPAMPDGESQNGTITPPIPFVEGNTKLTLNLNEETVKSLSVGDIVEIVFGENQTVTSITKVPEKSFPVPTSSIEA